jgi:hypothetical protein
MKPKVIIGKGEAPSVRKWTMSACAVLAWCLLPATVGAWEPGPAQAGAGAATSGGIASRTRVILAAAALAGRRKTARPARRRAPSDAAPGRTRHAAKKARIVLADHERLIVTNCAGDHAVYVLTPPGEDPGAVLRAARLVLPQDAYEDLAGRLGVPSAWLLE